MKHILLTISLVLGLHTANGNAEAPAAAQPSTAPAPGEASGFSGKVVETMNAASYTYVLVDTGSKKVWAAAPQFAVKTGDSVAVAAGMPMMNYHSKTLDRDFDVVYFAAGVAVEGTQPANSSSGPALPKGHPPLAGGTGKPDIDLTGIKRAEGGMTIQEIFAGKAKLSGQPVKVRGKVVKYNPMILGKNWLHLRDGTGSEGSNDLVLTTAAEVKVGDTVLVSGKISTEKDLGAGYKFAVLVDDATVVVEMPR
jgi:hypothetical protein